MLIMPKQGACVIESAVLEPVTSLIKASVFDVS